MVGIIPGRETSHKAEGLARYGVRSLHIPMDTLPILKTTAETRMGNHRRGVTPQIRTNVGNFVTFRIVVRLTGFFSLHLRLKEGYILMFLYFGIC